MTDQQKIDSLEVSVSQLKHAIREVSAPVECNHSSNTYNGEAWWCYDCKQIKLIEDIAKELAK